MNKEIAQRVKYLLLGDDNEDHICSHSSRRISEIICDEYPDFVIETGWSPIEEIKGNQMHGLDLVCEAAEVLGEIERDWYDKQHELFNP